jgi:hypothetical protein
MFDFIINFKNNTIYIFFFLNEGKFRLIEFRDEWIEKIIIAIRVNFFVKLIIIIQKKKKNRV